MFKIFTLMLQRQHRLTDDVTTDHWRHPQRAVPLHTTRVDKTSIVVSKQ